MTLPRLKRKTRLTADLARTISVDRANSRVGINSANPKAKLDVGGDINTTEIFVSDANNSSVLSANTTTTLTGTQTFSDVGIVTATSFTGIGSGLTGIGFTSLALVYDKKGSNTNGGSLTAGAWRQRDLNTIRYTDGVIDSDEAFVTVNSNEFALVPGRYLIEWDAPAMKLDGHVSRLISYDSSGGTENGTWYGVNTYSQDSSYYRQNTSPGVAFTSLTSTGYYKLWHRSNQGQSGDIGMGYSIQMGTGSGTWGTITDVHSTYAMIKISKF